MYMSICLHVCICTMAGAWESKKTVLYLLELTLQMIPSCCVTSGKQTQVLCESIKCSEPCLQPPLETFFKIKMPKIIFNLWVKIAVSGTGEPTGKVETMKNKSVMNIVPKSVTFHESHVWLWNLMRVPEHAQLLPLLYIISWLMVELIINIIENHCGILWSLLARNGLWKSRGAVPEVLFKQCCRNSAPSALRLDSPREVHSVYKT